MCTIFYRVCRSPTTLTAFGQNSQSISRSVDRLIVIVISKFLKCYSKAKCTRAPAYSRALQRIKGGFPKEGQEKLRSDFQNTRRGQSIPVKVGVVQMGRVNDQMGEGRCV